MLQLPVNSLSHYTRSKVIPSKSWEERKKNLHSRLTHSKLGVTFWEDRGNHGSLKRLLRLSGRVKGSPVISANLCLLLEIKVKGQR